MGDETGTASDGTDSVAPDSDQPSDDSADALASIKSELAAGFRSVGRRGLASAVNTADFHLWVQQESGWRPQVVSGRTNQGMVNGGLFQFWFGHSWARPHFSRGNDPRGSFTMSPAEQAKAVVKYFPHVTADSVKGFARQIRNGSYRGWG